MREYEIEIDGHNWWVNEVQADGSLRAIGAGVARGRIATVWFADNWAASNRRKYNLASSARRESARNL